MANESSDAGDLLSILLEDPLFKDDDEMIIDEILTFFFAGSQTSAVALSNMIMNLMKKPQQLEKLRQELVQDII